MLMDEKKIFFISLEIFKLIFTRRKYLFEIIKTEIIDTHYEQKLFAH